MRRTPSLERREGRSYTHGMETQHFSVRILAPADVVWKTMFDDST